MSSDEYIDKSNDLFAILGEEYSMVLATKFMYGIRDPTARGMVDSQVDEPYALPAVLRSFSKSTKSIRRHEMMSQQVDERRGNKMDAGDIMMEAMKNNQQMVCQVGEVNKELQRSGQSASSHRNHQPQIGYQPIVGTVGQQQANANRTSATGYQQPYNRHPDSQQSQSQPAYNPQANTTRQFRPRSEIKSFACGGVGHQSHECNANDPREQQERAPAGNRGSAPPKASDPIPAPIPSPAPVPVHSQGWHMSTLQMRNWI